ncbi:MAG: protein kinase [Deltaproteobacteria bacterium]|nr:protein kinase [Deltaproteobacteria bacterium]
MPGVEVLANTVDNILNRNFYYRPFWTLILMVVVLLFFGFFLSFILPGLKAGIGSVSTLLLFLAYGTAGSYLFFAKNIWLEISPPLLLLVIGYILIISKRFLVTKKIKEKGEDKKDHTDLSERISEPEDDEITTIFDEEGRPEEAGVIQVNSDTTPTFGRYEIVGELGRGAMGVVYKGEDPKIRRTVAIKTVRFSDFDEKIVDEMKVRFFREAESAGLLTHPNIVTIYDAGEEHDLAYIAMEFLKGRDLDPHTKKGNLLPVRETLSIVAQVAEALEYAHSKGIIHRDIKPANIMRIDETGEIKVTDFGIAKISASSRTKTGIIMGTPSYMSPEQVSGKKVDGRSDIFSLGVVLFELLCGKKPFNGDDMTSLMYMIAREKHPSIRSINPKIPLIIEKIIDKALEKDVNNRYQKAGQMAEHLKIILKKIDEAAKKKIKE